MLDKSKSFLLINLIELTKKVGIKILLLFKHGFNQLNYRETNKNY